MNERTYGCLKHPIHTRASLYYNKLARSLLRMCKLENKLLKEAKNGQK